MALQTPDQIGRFGELIVELMFSRTVRGKYQRPLFRPIFLGEKYPSVDYFVDVLDESCDAAGFFFVQVRSTTREAGSERFISISRNTNGSWHCRSQPT